MENGSKTDIGSGVGRTMGLFGATSVGVGAIVGGGILALAGTAFAVTGPSAILAFGLNGMIAVLTALSFAEMSAAFPESGGTYTFAKKVLSVRAAFMVGWVVWFASIVAAVLYAVGFGSFAAIIIEEIFSLLDQPMPAVLLQYRLPTVLALAAVGVYTLQLSIRSGGGGPWINVGKVAVFILLILGGVWAFGGGRETDVATSLTPFFPNGYFGLIQAMGYSFIALQGFDLIAAVAGEVKQPERNLPKAMLASLGIALAIYLPLLFIVSTVGMDPGQSVMAVGRAEPEAIIAIAARNYLGAFGYWLVMIAGVLSMLSALAANLFAASRVAHAMALDRTLPLLLEGISDRHGTPVWAVLATSGIVCAILLLVSGVAVAGAASSLIFLVNFALSHVICMLFRGRSRERTPFRVPLFPLVPVIGVLACVSLAIFQGFAVPSAGIIVAAWLAVGAFLYLKLFARKAGVADVSAQVRDPLLLQYRGKNPLVLVPIVNPANARPMIAVANMMTPPGIGRVLLLSVVAKPVAELPDAVGRQLENTQQVLKESLTAAFRARLYPEALTTIAVEPWTEISRVAETHRCESLVLGLTHFSGTETGNRLEELMNDVDCDVVVLKAPNGWRLSSVRKVLVPAGGKSVNYMLRTRILSSLWRLNRPEISFMRIVPEHLNTEDVKRAWQQLVAIAGEEVPGVPQVTVVQNDSVEDAVLSEAARSDLLVLGLQQTGRRRRRFGELTLNISQKANCAVVLISKGFS